MLQGDTESDRQLRGPGHGACGRAGGVVAAARGSAGRPRVRAGEPQPVDGGAQPDRPQVAARRQASRQPGRQEELHHREETAPGPGPGYQQLQTI